MVLKARLKKFLKKASGKSTRNSKQDEQLKRIRNSIESVKKDGWASLYSVDIRCEPVIDILSVHLQSEVNSLPHINRDSWKIDGEIFVHDGQGNDKYYIYEHEDLYEPEIIPLTGGALSLTGPDDVVSLNKPHISMSIRDRDSGEAIIDGTATLSTTIDLCKQSHDIEQFYTTTIRGSVCSAVVKYLALTFGVYAKVRVKIRQNESESTKIKYEKEEQELEVYGMISISYNLPYHSEKKANSIMLFEFMDPEEFESVTVGSLITLSRSVVAVPGYSSLRVQVDLMDRISNTVIVQGSCEFTSDNYPGSNQTIIGPNGLNALVTVDWREPFMLDRLQTPSLRLVDVTYNMPNPPKTNASRAVELFSIFIGRQNDERLSLHGMVVFANDRGYSTIFRRDKSNPYILPSGSNFLSLEGPRDTLLPDDAFFFSVDLEDAEGRVSIKGFAGSSQEIDERKAAWYNRLLCTVIKGAYERSFAALNYTVFSHAFKANVRVLISSEEDSPSACRKVHGCLVASHGNYEYKTCYDKVYQQIVLFERPEENPLEMSCNDSCLDLSRSVVVVPYNSTLRLLADLKCCLSTGFTGCFSKSVEIECDQDIVGFHVDGVKITIAVEWSKV